MSRHLETCGCPVCQGVDKTVALQPIQGLPHIPPQPGPKRLLIVWNRQVFRQDHITTMLDWMGHRGFNMWAIACYDDGGPDLRIFDLDGAPAPDTGLIQELLAAISKPKTVWTPGGEFIPVADACDECEGAGQVTTDTAECLSCHGSGRKKQVASA